jgi:hypothetical protein
LQTPFNHFLLFVFVALQWLDVGIFVAAGEEAAADLTMAAGEEAVGGLTMAAAEDAAVVVLQPHMKAASCPTST